MVFPAIGGTIAAGAAAGGSSGLSLAGVGFLLSGLGSLGGLFGGGGDKPPSLHTQNVIANRWRGAAIDQMFEKAKQWGVHPSVMLGSSAGGYTPAFAFGSQSGPDRDYSSIGQNLGRVFDSMSTRKDRATKDTYDLLQLENMGLQNDLLRSQITRINRSGVPASDDLSIFEGGVSPHKAGDPSRADLPPMTSWRTLTTPDGREVVVPSPEAANWMENDWLGTPRWYGDLIYGAIANSGQATGRWLRKKYEQFRGR